MKPDGKKLMLYLLTNTVLLAGLYYLIPYLTKGKFEYMPHIYIVLGAVLALYYVIYNRGFVGKNTTPDMLPGNMSSVEKQRFLDESRERQKKSRWVLTLLIPIIVTFFIDVIYLFLFEVLF